MIGKLYFTDDEIEARFYALTLDLDPESIAEDDGWITVWPPLHAKEQER